MRQRTIILAAVSLAALLAQPVLAEGKKGNGKGGGKGGNGGNGGKGDNAAAVRPANNGGKNAPKRDGSGGNGKGGGGGGNKPDRGDGSANFKPSDRRPPGNNKKDNPGMAGKPDKEFNRPENRPAKPEGKPGGNDRPGKPTEPEKPDRPTTKPGNGGDWGFVEPSPGEKPSRPEKPGRPEKPVNPEEPSRPEKPIKPSRPEKPTWPENPNQPGEPDNGNRPNRPIDPGWNNRPNRPTDPGWNNRPNRPGNGNGNGNWNGSGNGNGNNSGNGNNNGNSYKKNEKNVNKIKVDQSTNYKKVYKYGGKDWDFDDYKEWDEERREDWYKYRKDLIDYRYDRAREVRYDVGYHAHPYFNSNWWGVRVGAPVVVSNPDWWWRPSPWTAVSAFFGAAFAKPVSYDYGSQVIINNNTVYHTDGRKTSTKEYADTAAALARPAVAVPPPVPTEASKDEWLPMGVWALTEEEKGTATIFLQISINKAGLVSGGYNNSLTGESGQIIGSIDQKSQRVAWRMGENGKTVFETGLYNLTQDVASTLVHYPTGKEQTWLLVRMPSPGDDSELETPAIAKE